MGTYFVLSVLPLIAYVLGQRFFGLKQGLYSAMLAVGILIAYHYSIVGSIDTFLLAEALLFFAAGMISLKSENPKFFKFQPVVMGVIASLVLIWFQLFDQPILIAMLPKAKLMLPDQAHLFDNPKIIGSFARMSFNLCWVFPAHALVLAWSALRWSNAAWLVTRLAIIPLVFLVSLFSTSV